jgi:pyruvate,water dikinase
LKTNENSDLLENCSGLTASLFKEIFNIKLWEWYAELGLVTDSKPREYIQIVKGRLMFEEDVEKELVQKKNFVSNLLTSMRFSVKITKALELYYPKIIEKIYFDSLNLNYSKFSSSEIKTEFERLWTLLIDNFKYSIISSLILQYNLKLSINSEYQEDFVAKKINALIDLNEHIISKADFDQEFGFLAEQDYDFSYPRYYELKQIKTRANKKLSLKTGLHNFREHVKLHDIMLIALIRKLLLSTKIKNVFSMTKEDVLASLEGKTINVNSGSKEKKENKNETEKKTKKESKKILKRELDLQEKKLLKNKKEIKSNKENTPRKQEHKLFLQGVHFSGEGEIEAQVHVLNSVKEFKPEYKDSLIVVKTLNPDFVMLMPSVAGIIAENGGKLSHLAIVARERNFPLVGQVEDATNLLKKAKIVRLLINEGKVILVK